jgi:hypothetical protein
MDLMPTTVCSSVPTTPPYQTACAEAASLVGAVNPAAPTTPSHPGTATQSPLTIPSRPGFGQAPFSRTASMMSGSASFHAMAPLGHAADDDDDAVAGQLGMLEDMERFAARLVHSFPMNAVGQVRTRC